MEKARALSDTVHIMMGDDPRQHVAESAEEQGAFFRIVPPEAGEVGPTLYANWVQVGFSPHDFRLTLGIYAFPPLQEMPTGQVPVPVEPISSVTLPLNLVKGLVRALEMQIAAWEKGFNEPLPDQPQAASPEGGAA